MNEAKILNAGFVKLIEYMGNDKTIADSARVSFDNFESERDSEKDKKLIKYLMEHRHTSPFEQVEFRFWIKAPKFIASQWMRHRTANINEVSARYTKIKDEFYIPLKEDIMFQSKTNKQGRDTNARVDDSTKEEVLAIFKKSYESSYKEYERLLQLGIARELARSIIPQGFYTEWIWKIDLHNLMHFLSLRMDRHAQKEIRDYAVAIYNLIKTVVPVTCELFKAREGL